MKYFNAFQLVAFLSGAPILFIWLCSNPFTDATVLCIPLALAYLALAGFTINLVGDVS